jgi:hypothetical protein
MQLHTQDVRRRRDQPSGIALCPDGDTQKGRDARFVELPNKHRTFAQRRREFRTAPRRMPREYLRRVRKARVFITVIDDRYLLAEGGSGYHFFGRSAEKVVLMRKARKVVSCAA